MRLPESRSNEARFGQHAVVVLDRQPLWLTAISEVLERAGFTVSGTTISEAILLQLVRERQPDALIFEPESCTSSTERFIAAARSTRPGLRAIAVSSADDHDTIRASLSAGADAYVLKRAEAEDIAVAVRQTFAHSIHLARALEPSTVGSVGATVDEPSLVPLTRREREILALVAEGHSNAAMARQLWVTEQTVKFHLSNIYRKLDVPNRTAATRWAHEHGLAGAVSVV
jgi:NarL family two-component system response regulator LiaR